MGIKNIRYIVLSALSALFAVSCTNLDESAFSPGSTVYTQDFSTGMGKFTEVSVTGDQKWEYSATYGCMVMTGYVDTNGDGTKENIENEDWLISPQIDLTGLKAAQVTFEHAGSYFTSLSTSTTLWISEDYTDGLPSTATWTQLTITKDVTNSSDFTFVTPEVSLTKYAGKKVRIALKYNSTSSKAGTWEVKSFSVKSTEAEVIQTVDNGKGTEASPYTVKGATAAQGTSGWVSGYVVGYLWSGTYTSYVFGADTCTQATNIMIADTVGSVYVARCMPVQLPTGVLRTAFNLKDNKSLIGKKITLYGSLESYFSLAGIKSVSYGITPDGTAVGTKPVEPIYSETFAASLGSFSTYSVSGAQVWAWASGYGAKMTGYVSANYANEDWLISPEVDLSSETSPGMHFDQTGRYFGTMANEATVWISSDYVSGDPTAATWTKLTIPTYMTGTNWTFVNSGEIDLTAYIGKKVKIAFKYISSTTAAATWEVKNFVVYK